MKNLFLLSAGLVAAMAVASCDEVTSTAGSSLVQDQVEIIIDSTFTVSGKAVINDLVQSRTVLQLLGRIDAQGYGSLSSDIVCQYMPSNYVDTIGVKPDYIDSVKLVLTMFKDGFAGDSVVPMGVSVYPLTRQLTSPIYSNFNPDGYYDASRLLGSTTYSGLIDGADGVAADNSGNIYKDIYVTLPREFGVALYNQFKTDENTFSTPQALAKWFPGLYIANSFGSGRVTRIVSNMINVYFRSVQPIPDTDPQRDTVLYGTGTYLAVTPEIITNNNIAYKMSESLKQRASSGEALLVGPTGYDVEFTFPAREIISRYKAQSNDLSVINSLTLSIPVEEIENDYGLTPPPYVLLVKKKDKEKFFSGTQINDNISSFYASYNSTDKSYTFSAMRDYLMDVMSHDEVTAEDEEFVICPALVSFFVNSSNNYYSYYYGTTTSTTVSSITPYVTEPVMGKLDFENAKINFTFTKQTISK
ncbi:MAG: DUF4270 domain-containing protein [Duncaniella sp.]|uniref:DUF4270 family protein n=1 Tax=Duncaniella sp. TaxID=2518496 RepID=UPI001990DC6E|nr:DUF4270 family protein [Duncaniella sp.]MBD5334498.1 DUF4270 domain-containing protein [Bacteroides sp.]MDE6089854.1 DUF4270 domain-containing protein [Duncaniella sp.]